MHVTSVTRVTVIAIHQKMNNTCESIIGPKDTRPLIALGSCQGVVTTQSCSSQRITSKAHTTAGAGNWLGIALEHGADELDRGKWQAAFDCSADDHSHCTRNSAKQDPSGASGLLSSRFHLPVFEQIAFDRNWASFLRFKPTWGDSFNGSKTSGPCACVPAVAGSCCRSSLERKSVGQNEQAGEYTQYSAHCGSGAAQTHLLWCCKNSSSGPVQGHLLWMVNIKKASQPEKKFWMHANFFLVCKSTWPFDCSVGWFGLLAMPALPKL